MGRDNFPRREKHDQHGEWKKPRKADKFFRQKRREAKIARRGY